MPRTPKLEHGVEWGGRTGVLLTTPYDETFVDELKSTLPPDDRAFLRLRRGWWVAGEHVTYALDLLLRFWPAVSVFDDPDDGDYLIRRGGEIVHQETLFD